MTLRTLSDSTEKDRVFRLRAALLSPRDLERLRRDCGNLYFLADRLETITSNVPLTCRPVEAQQLADRLSQQLPADLEKEEAVMRVVERLDDPLLFEAIGRTRLEHAAMRDLVIPVVRGLRSIGKDRLPTRISRFVVATDVLCEFVRKHVQFKREELYPLLTRLKVPPPWTGKNRSGKNEQRKTPVHG